MQRSIGIGDRVLARVTALDEPDVEGARYEAEPIRVLPRDRRRLLGIFRARQSGGGTIEPVDRASSSPGWSRRATRETPATAISCASISRPRGRHCVPRARVLERARQPARPAQDQPDRGARPRHSGRVPRGVLAETETLEPPALAGRTDFAAPAARHHRPGGRPRPRRRRLRRARHRSPQQGRAHRHRRHRRRRPLRPTRLEARQGGGCSAATRSISPTASCRCCPRRSRTTSASCAKARSARASRYARLRSRRREALPHLHARRDALGGEAQLPGGAGGDRRTPDGEGRRTARFRARRRYGRPMAPSRPPATGAGRSTSTSPSARSCSTARGASPASSCRSASPRTASSRSS